jgi:hypothetical protein
MMVGLAVDMAEYFDKMELSCNSSVTRRLWFGRKLAGRCPTAVPRAPRVANFGREPITVHKQSSHDVPKYCRGLCGFKRTSRTTKAWQCQFQLTVKSRGRTPTNYQTVFLYPSRLHLILPCYPTNPSSAKNITKERIDGREEPDESRWQDRPPRRSTADIPGKLTVKQSQSLRQPKDLLSCRSSFVRRKGSRVVHTQHCLLL